MIIALLIGAGLVVLLVAPTIHRNINAKSRREAENQRVSRVASLRASEAGSEREFAKATDAALLRDRLLLRGVRAELIQERGRTLLVYNATDDETVSALTLELDIG